MTARGAREGAELDFDGEIERSNYTFSTTPRAWNMEVDGNRIRQDPSGFAGVKHPRIRAHFGWK